MRAVIIENEELVIRETKAPTPNSHQLLIRVHAAGVNGADIIQRAGKYPAPAGSPQDIPGLEFAGEVIAVGDQAFRFAVGDNVMSIVGGGGQAEYVAINERLAIPVPKELPLQAAGGFCEAFATAYDALFHQAHLQMGERLLVTGAAGGVGSAAVQLGALCGAEVYASVRDLSHEHTLKELGAKHVFIQDEIQDHGPFDVSLELVGSPNVKATLRALQTGGRIVVIGVGGGFKVEMNLLALMDKRASISGSTLRSRPLEEKATLMRALEHHVLPAVADKRVSVPVAASYPLEEAALAYQHFSNGGKLGKIILEL